MTAYPMWSDGMETCSSRCASSATQRGGPDSNLIGTHHSHQVCFLFELSGSDKVHFTCKHCDDPTKVHEIGLHPKLLFVGSFSILENYSSCGVLTASTGLKIPFAQIMAAEGNNVEALVPWEVSEPAAKPKVKGDATPMAPSGLPLVELSPLVGNGRAKHATSPLE